MISYRVNVFETNSSSTHSLCIIANSSKNNEEDLLKEYKISVWETEDLTEAEYFTSIEDKLKYLYTAYTQKYFDDDLENWEKHPLAIALHKLIPNLTFIPSKHDYNYVFEDVEILFDDYWHEPAIYETLLKEDNLKRFLLEGTICFFNRDNEYQTNKYNYLEKEIIFCEWSG